MSKHSQAFKRQVIESYLSGQSGYSASAQRYGIDNSTVRKWVAAYRLHGESALTKKYTYYSAPFKLSVLQPMCEHALSHREVAAGFDIRNPSSVGQWEHKYYSGRRAALVPGPKGRRKKMPKTPVTPPLAPEGQTRSLEDVLAENAYLRMEVAYLKKLDALIQAKKLAAQKKKRKSRRSTIVIRGAMDIDA